MGGGHPNDGHQGKAWPQADGSPLVSFRDVTEEVGAHQSEEERLCENDYLTNLLVRLLRPNAKPTDAWSAGSTADQSDT